MSDEDWDDSGANTTAPASYPMQMRSFGSRGRGFTPMESLKSSPENRGFVYPKKNNDIKPKPGKSFGKSFRNVDDDCDYNNKNNKCWVDLKSSSENTSGPHVGIYKAKSKEDKPKAKTYVPVEITNNEEELFSNFISSGINFDRYDDIEVKVSGENIPSPINSFERAGLNELLYSNIKKCKYSKPTPIQKYAIPIALNGRDMMACAQTGSGKTAAFLIPVINRLLEDNCDYYKEGDKGAPQLLVITPTRELAIQIYGEAKKFAFGSSLKIAICYGGTSVNHQLFSIKSGCNILIATPGRVIDFLNRKAVTFSKVQYLVLDEADRMLDMNFLPEIERILHSITNNENTNLNTFMFSATFPEEIQRLAKNYLKDYLFLAVGIVGGACTDVDQKFYSVAKFDKRLKLIELLTEHRDGKTLVFVEKKRTADIIAAFLSEKDFPATSMHGDREQILREEALNDFKSGKMDILVATAVAARGLDIKNVSHVINFDLPKSVEEYVHRIGRTGRLGNRGLASSFFDSAVDCAIAPDLIRILAQAEQEVPDFLQDGANNLTFNTTCAYKFGGKDIRKGKEKNEDTYLPSSNVYDDEVW